jgi:predicted Zn finger-like uncharacterized protein
MIIICENCTAKFNLDESLLNQKGSRVRCSQCSHLFLAFPKGYGPEKIIPPSIDVEKSPPDETAPPQPDNSVDEEQHAPVDESVETKLDSPFPSPGDLLEADDIDFDADLDLDMELDFSEDDFDFDESDLELGLGLDDPAPEGLDSINDDSLTEETITPHETEDDLELELELDLDFDLDMELELDDTPPDDADSMDDDTLTEKAITPHETEDDLDLDLDFDLDMELELDDTPPDDADSMDDDTMTEKAITPHETEEELELDLDFDLDMELELDDTPPDDADSMDDEFSLELDLDEDIMPTTPDETQDSPPPPLTTDTNELPFVQEQEISLIEEDKSTAQSDVEKKDIPKEPGDDIPIASSSLAEPLPQDTPSDIEKKSSPIVKLFIFFILLLILLLGAHAASLMTGITIPFVSDLKIPFLTEFVTPEPPPPPPIRLVPDKKSINGRFESNQKEGRLFIITGNIHNTSQFTCTNVKVTALLINTEKVKIKSKTVTCGVTIPAQQLATLDLSAMDKLLRNPGPQNALSLAPGKFSPFMIVFSKLPDNLENFTVTVDKFDKK